MSVPKDSIVLVSGVNGLIASHVADQLVLAGYRVRGTVRDLSRASWMQPLFTSRHGAGKLELVTVPDLTAERAWDEAIKDVSGVVSVAGTAELSVTDVDATVEQEQKACFGLLQAAKAQATVKAFVYTSSAWAAWTPKPDVPMTVTAESWNESAVKLAAEPDVPVQQKGIATYMAVKTLVERGLWAWIDRESPAFVFNTVLPDTVLGPILNARHQAGSTAGMVRGLWERDEQTIALVAHIPPQWYIDARDCGRLYVAALTTPGVDRERIFGFAGKYSWPKVVEIFKKQHPEKTDFVELADAGWDQTTVPDQRALDLLRRLGYQQWISLEDSIRDNVDSFLH